MALLQNFAIAADLLTPSGLNPGDSFRFIFQTAGATSATSADIATYNTFVNQQAGGATYGGQPVTWYVIGSTATVNARDNVGGFGTAVPVYLVTGSPVASGLTTTTGGLWSGAVSNAVRKDIAGNTLAEARVWTGTGTDGQKYPTAKLGDVVARFGVNSYTDPIWIQVSQDSNGATYSMYAVSQTLTVVPEPSTLVLAMVAAGLIAGLACFRKGRKRRPVPV